jgi:hypothetical protein
LPAAKPEPIREKHQAAIDAIFADVGVPKRATDLINALLSDAEDIEAQRDEAIEDADTLRDQVEQRDSDQDACLTHVKYWMIDTLVHHRPMTDPRAVLRKIEDAIG